MKSLTPLLLLSLLAVGCSGGSPSALPAPVAVATAAPTQAPVSGPSAAPTASASPKPSQSPTAAPSAAPTATAAPTIAPAVLKRIGGAPLTATASQLAVGRRAGQSLPQAQGVTNGLPILVESSGMIAAWAGDFGIWTSNASTGQDIPQTSMTVTPSGNLPINNPAPTALSCLGVVSAMCAVHPTAFQFGTASINGKAVGKQTVAIAFADGTAGTTTSYVYDGWDLPCNSGFAYVGGVPVAEATLATSDIYADCTTATIKLPLGEYVLSQPSADQYGNNATIMPQFTAGPIFIANIGNVPMASIPAGMVFAIQTRDGGSAKVYFSSGAGVAVNAAQGMSLHSNVSGGFDF